MAKKNISAELNRFLQEHPGGWTHDDWLGLLYHLSESGIDTTDEDGIGLALEHQRLVNILDHVEIKGLGPKRIEAIANHFGTLWNLMGASPEEVEGVPGVPATLSRQVADNLQ